MYNICSIKKTNKWRLVLIDVKYFSLWCVFQIIISPKDLSIKSNGQNTIKDKSKIIALVHGTQHMKRSTSRYTQSLCLPDTRWRKTLLQTKSDIIPQFNLSEKHIGGFILLYSVSLRQGGPLCPNLLYYIVYTSVYIIYFLKPLKRFCFFFLL